VCQKFSPCSLFSVDRHSLNSVLGDCWTFSIEVFVHQVGHLLPGYCPMISLAQNKTFVMGNSHHEREVCLFALLCDFLLCIQTTTPLIACATGRPSVLSLGRGGFSCIGNPFHPSKTRCLLSKTVIPRVAFPFFGKSNLVNEPFVGLVDSDNHSWLGHAARCGCLLPPSSELQL